jgi:serine/threonine-protein kinase RsbW
VGDGSCLELALHSVQAAGQRLIGSAHGNANTDTLAACLELAERCCEQLGLEDEDALAIRLCIDEACANVVMHAYPEDQSGPVALVCWSVPPSDDEPTARVVVCLVDQGMEFDPSETAAPVLEGDVEDRPMGGLGWFLVDQMMDEVVHRRSAAGHNINTLTRRLRGPALA